MDPDSDTTFRNSGSGSSDPPLEKVDLDQTFLIIKIFMSDIDNTYFSSLQINFGGN